MNMFSFILKNSDILKDIDVSEKGEIIISYDDFDFSHPDLVIEESKDGFIFTVSIVSGPFILFCEVLIKDFYSAVPYLSKIHNSSVKKLIIESLEGSFMDKTLEELKISKDNLHRYKRETEGIELLCEDVSNTLGDLKSEWGII